MLPLDGQTKITFTNVGSSPVKIYLYPAEDNLQATQANDLFQKFIDDYNSFYDFIHLKNTSLNSQLVALRFTDNGIVVDNKKVEVRSNNFPYAIKDKVHIWTAAGKPMQITNAIYKGEEPKTENGEIIYDPQIPTIIPLTSPYQVQNNIVQGIDTAGQEITDYDKAVYHYLLLAKSSVTFSVFCSLKEMPDIDMGPDNNQKSARAVFDAAKDDRKNIGSFQVDGRQAANVIGQ